MRTKSGQDLAIRVVDFFKNNNNNKAATVRHFCAENKAKSTVYDILNRYINDGKVQYSTKRGPKATVCCDKTVEKVTKFYDKFPLATTAKAAGKFMISETSIRKCKKMANIKTIKRKIAPRYVKNQPERCVEAAKVILKKTMPKNGDKIVVMDDETYVYKEPEENASVTYYNEREGVTIPNEVRFKKKTKFAGKYMIWQAVCQDGKASPVYIVKGSLNNVIYEKKILKGVLIPWLKLNYDLDKIIFWPDLATSHYTKNVVDLLERENIDFIRKDENCPNLPQARPIERYWALCKRAYSKLPKKPNSDASFKRHWNKISNNIIKFSGQRLFENLREKLKSVKKHGPYGPLLPKN